MKRHILIIWLFFTFGCVEVTFPQSSGGEKASELIYLKHTRAKDMLPIVQTLLPEVRIYPDETRNALQVYDYPSVIEQLKEIIRAQDVPYSQAIIELNVVEISRNRTNQVGIELKDYSWNLPTLLPPKVETLTGEDIANLFPGLVYLKGERAQVNIKANPKVLVVGNQTATFGAGDRVPIPITQTQVVSGQIAQTTSIQFEEVGVKLQVTPYIFPEQNEVLINLIGEVSAIGKTTTEGYPQIATRNIQTSIRIKDNWTAVLGGLLKEEDRQSYIGVPILMDMPILGYLFKRTKLEKVLTEVQIYIRPKIVSTEQLNQPVEKR